MVAIVLLKVVKDETEVRVVVVISPLLSVELVVTEFAVVDEVKYVVKAFVIRVEVSVVRLVET